MGHGPDRLIERLEDEWRGACVYVLYMYSQDLEATTNTHANRKQGHRGPKCPLKGSYNETQSHTLT